MTFISETASAIKSRFGFHDHASESVASGRSSPDLKAVSVDNGSQSLVAASAVRSIEWDDCGVGSVSSSSQSFEFREDPGFWKDHNVQVIIRVRPLSSSEVSVQGHSKCVKQESCQAITWIGHPESRFTFDLVADENVSQENLFNVAGVPMVENCVGGYNSCMFAYGQTGSGKTHTMLGDIEGGTRRHSVNCGMTPRVFEYLFSRIQKEKEARRDEKFRFICKCSFLEIYNEQILDLLEPSSNNLQIREDVKKGVYVENLKEIEVTSARDVMQQLIQGAANRKVAATNMNRASSRSHSVFTCIIESKWESQGVTHHRFARLNLVDLAGSERQKSSGAEGERLKEATNINKSLSTLGLVIMNLVSLSNGKSLHVPYRDSKLTFLLQDSLGGNSKTTIIANISPASCCSLETLSTLKFAQRAKFIKNNAIVNEDASGDVIAMRIQIQQLKKEVSRLQCIVNGGAENQDCDALTLSFPGSPGCLKWEGLQGSCSPLASGKRISRKKDYEVALVGAFRREKDKDIALQALTAENQAAMKLAKQREDEIRGLKMRLRLREAGVKRLEAVASGKISVEAHLLKEKEDLLKEIEVLKNQVDRNQEVTRFAMENLRLKEEIRRLKSFCEEGEREIMNEQILVLENRVQELLLEALDWKLMHESYSLTVQEEVHGDNNLPSANQQLGLPPISSLNEENEFLRMQAIQNKAEMDSLLKKLDLCLQEKEKWERSANELLWKLEEERSAKATKEGLKQTELGSFSTDVPVISLNDQMELKSMVDAIAAASEREAEAHEKVVIFSKENEELRKKIMVLLEDNNKLIELYEQANAENKYKNMTKAECDQEAVNKSQQYSKLTEGEEIEMKKVNENLEHQLMEMHEENEKLMGLYEEAMKERDEFKRMLSCCAQSRVESTREFDCPEKLVEVDGGERMGHPNFVEANLVMEGISEDARMFTEEPGSHGPNAHVVCPGNYLENKGMQIDVETLSNMEVEPSKHIAVKVSEELDLVRKKLDRAQKKLLDSTSDIKVLTSLEKAIIEVDKVSSEIELVDDGIQVKQQEFEKLVLLSSEMHQRIVLSENKLSALKYSLSSFSSSVSYFEQRGARARARVTASMSYLDKKEKELAHLQVRKDETAVAHRKIQQCEVELRNHLMCLSSKFEEENRMQENEKVLFSLDNVVNVDPPQRNWHLGGKATQLLKSEEEKTRLQNEMKSHQEKLRVSKRELKDLNCKLEKLEWEIQSVQMDLSKGMKTVEEMDLALQRVLEEKDTILELRENGKTEIGNVILEYQQHVFDLALKQAETEVLETELHLNTKKIEELQTMRAVAAKEITRMLEDRVCNSCLCEKMEQELQSVRDSMLEVKSILEGNSNNH